MWDIYVYHELEGYSAKRITEEVYPDLTQSQVYAALAYYFDHRQEIDSQVKADDEFIEKLKESTGPGPLAEKLASGEISGDSISP